MVILFREMDKYASCIFCVCPSGYFQSCFIHFQTIIHERYSVAKLYLFHKLCCSKLIGLHDIIFRYQPHTVPLGFEKRSYPPISVRLFVNVNKITAPEAQLILITGRAVPKRLIHIRIVDVIRFLFRGARRRLVCSFRDRRCGLSSCRSLWSVRNFFF